jgi:hypothetical protein
MKIYIGVVNSYSLKQQLFLKDYIIVYSELEILDKAFDLSRNYLWYRLFFGKVTGRLPSLNKLLKEYQIQMILLSILSYKFLHIKKTICLS